MKVVTSNGVSCDSACNTLDTGTGAPYTNYFCYGSVGLDGLSPTSQPANGVVASGWYGNAYCGSTNGMNRYCCCKSNYDNTK